MKEKLAELCHQQWASWMDYLFSKGSFNPDGSWSMPKEFVDRWRRQAATDYKDLSEAEKDSDRAEADKFMELVELKRHFNAGFHIGYDRSASPDKLEEYYTDFCEAMERNRDE